MTTRSAASTSESWSPVKARQPRRFASTPAGASWLFDNFSEVKEMGSCSPPFMADVAKALGERYEPA